MATLDTEFDIGELTSQVTMKLSLKGMRVFRLRLWLGKQLLWFAVKVIGCKPVILED